QRIAVADVDAGERGRFGVALPGLRRLVFPVLFAFLARGLAFAFAAATTVPIEKTLFAGCARAPTRNLGGRVRWSRSDLTVPSRFVGFRASRVLGSTELAPILSCGLFQGITVFPKSPVGGCRHRGGGHIHRPGKIHILVVESMILAHRGHVLLAAATAAA